MKKTLLAVLVIVVAMTFLAAPRKKEKSKPHALNWPVQDSVIEDTPPVNIPTFEDARKLITVDKNKEFLYWFADDAREGRMSGKKGNREAAEFIKKKFELFGLQTSYQKFPIRRMNPGPNNETGDDFSQNVIGILPGKTNRVITITSHVDHVGYGPQMTLDNKVGIHNGADDNGSGCTGVVALAEAFSKAPKLEHTLVFITFSGEEMGLVGSKYYVKSLSKEKVQEIDLMINFDMIGRLSNNTCQAIGARKNPKLMEVFGKLQDQHRITFEPSTGDNDNGSDHAPFRDAGVPFCFFFTGMHKDYHRVSDKPDTINYEGLTNIVRFAFDVVASYDKK